jgi:hypothetical protein
MVIAKGIAFRTKEEDLVLTVVTPDETKIEIILDPENAKLAMIEFDRHFERISNVGQPPCPSFNIVNKVVPGYA